MNAWNAHEVDDRSASARQDQWWECVDALLEMASPYPAGLAAAAAAALCAVNDVEEALRQGELFRVFA